MSEPSELPPQVVKFIDQLLEDAGLIDQNEYSVEETLSALTRNAIRAQKVFQREMEHAGHGIPSEAQVALVGGVVLLECLAAIRTVLTLKDQGASFSAITDLAPEEMVQVYTKFVAEKCEVFHG